MKTFLEIVGSIALTLVFAFASCGCDSDQDVPGNPADTVGDNPGDQPDTTDPPGDVVEEDGEEADAGPDLFELCEGYAGLWDCTCTAGVCEGQTTTYNILLLDILEHQHTFWIQQIGGSGLVQFSFVCNENSPPASDGQGTEFTAEDGLLHIYAKSQYTEDWFIEECTPHPTD